MDDNTILESEHKAALAKARDEGREEGARSAVDRIKGILALDEAKGREAQAQAIAFETQLDAAQAKAILSAGAFEAPAQQAVAPALRPDAMAPATASAAQPTPDLTDKGVVKFDAKASLKKHVDRHNAHIQKASKA